VSRNLETRVRIDAPPEAVWRVLGDLAGFADWCEDVAFPEPAAEGERAPMRVRLFGVRLTVKVRFERVEGPHELRWRGGPAGLFEGSHYFRLAPAPGGGSELRHGEDFSGLALPLLFPLLSGELSAFYDRINAALKGRVEAASRP
jgi:hypothetical protein